MTRGRLLAALVILAVFATVGWIATRPVPLDGLGAMSHPVSSYGEALGLIQELRRLDDRFVNASCGIEFMGHGRKTERAIVLIHGLTNCPMQFHALGKLFHDQGYNVLIPRVPHHGLADRMTTDQARLTARELAAITAASVDIAEGLGEHVTVAGLSMSGVMAAWAGQHRPGVDLAVVIAPTFSYRLIPRGWGGPASNLIAGAPNFFLWWNPKAKEDRAGSDVAYPRVASRALGEVLRLSLAVEGAARRVPPAAGSILVVTNGNDEAIDRGALESVVRSWRARAPGRVYEYEFDKALRLPHDLIDPQEAGQRIEIVYPKLIEIVNAMAEAAEGRAGGPGAVGGAEAAPGP